MPRRHSWQVYLNFISHVKCWKFYFAQLKPDCFPNANWAILNPAVVPSAKGSTNVWILKAFYIFRACLYAMRYVAIIDIGFSIIGFNLIWTVIHPFLKVLSKAWYVQQATRGNWASSPWTLRRHLTTISAKTQTCLAPRRILMRHWFFERKVLTHLTRCFALHVHERGRTCNRIKTGKPFILSIFDAHYFPVFASPPWPLITMLSCIVKNTTPWHKSVQRVWQYRKHDGKEWDRDRRYDSLKFVIETAADTPELNKVSSSKQQSV